MKNEKIKELKVNNGITLIALVITIIVLLILAGISITLISGNNGILQRAKDVKNKSSEAQIREQINLAYHSALTTGLGKLEEGILKSEIKKEFKKSDEELDNQDNPKWLDKDIVKDKNQWRITIDGVYLDVLAEIENNQNSTSAINYGEGKTASNVAQGDTISITFDKGQETEYTEQFMVLKKYENKIMAMPYFNLKLYSNPIKQETSSNYSAGMKAFSSESSPAWNVFENIDMINTTNNIQSYITEYSTQLSNATNGIVTAEIGRYYGDYSLKDVDSNLLNPSGKGEFLLGSSSYSRYSVYLINSNGSFSSCSFDATMARCTPCYIYIIRYNTTKYWK